MVVELGVNSKNMNMKRSLLTLLVCFLAATRVLAWNTPAQSSPTDGATKEKHAVFTQAKVQGGQRPRLQFGIEIDQDVAAGHNIKPQERWVGHQVLPGKGDAFAQVACYLHAAINGREVARRQFGLHLGQRRQRVHRATGNGEGNFVDQEGRLVIVIANLSGATAPSRST